MSGRCGVGGLFCFGTNREETNQLRELLCFRRQISRRCRTLFDHGCVLLRYLVHLVDRDVDLTDAGGLLFGSLRHLADQRVDLHDLFNDAFEGLTGFADRLHPGTDMFAGDLDQCLNFLGRLARTLRKRAHLARHHGKSLARIAGPRCLDTGIKRKQVGLKRDLVDDSRDVRDLL